jgi:hypothetical protein
MRLLSDAVLDGRDVDQETIALFDDLAVVLCDADPRIWPPKIVRLIGSYGAEIPAFVAGYLVFHRSFIGPRAIEAAAEMLIDLRARFGDAPARADLQRYVEERPRVPGFGVPFRPSDPRVELSKAVVARRALADGAHWRLAWDLAEVVATSRRAPPNVALTTASILLDRGLAPEEIGSLTTSFFQNIFLANAIEEARSPHPILRRLPGDNVRYEGRPARMSPRALAETVRSDRSKVP